MAQACEPGTRVIHGEIHARSQVSHRRTEGRIVRDGRMFGHLQHEASAAIVQDGAQRLSRDDELGRRVQVEPCRAWQGPRRREGSPECGNLQFGPEADHGRCGEHGLGIGTVGEARERLVADDLIAPEIDDRLEDRPDGLVPDDGRDVIAASPRLGPLGHVAADERPGQVGELDEGRQGFDNGDLLGGLLGNDEEQPDELFVVSDRRVRNRAAPELVHEPVVRVRGPIHPGLDPGALGGPLVEVPAAVGREPSQRRIGLTRDDEADRHRVSIEFKEEERRGREAGEGHDLAADSLRGDLRRIT
jgi:hypothetical protein